VSGVQILQRGAVFASVVNWRCRHWDLPRDGRKYLGDVQVHWSTYTHSCVCCKRLKFDNDAVLIDLQSRRQDEAFRLLSEV